MFSKFIFKKAVSYFELACFVAAWASGIAMAYHTIDKPTDDSMPVRVASSNILDPGGTITQ